MILVYTDGSSRGNPGPGGWGAVIHAEENVIELGGKEKHTTNNQMELLAAIKALEWISLNKKIEKNEDSEQNSITVKSDSKYVIQGITSWVFGWKKNGWKTASKKDVGNREYWEALDKVSSKLNVSWVHVDGHVGIAGNERCDEIATEFATDKDPVLYNGLFDAYSIDLHFKDVEGEKTKTAKKSRKTGPAYSYLSLVDGGLQKHNTWEECKSRVHGKKAKFKKTMNAEEETLIIADWAKNI